MRNSLEEATAVATITASTTNISNSNITTMINRSNTISATSLAGHRRRICPDRLAKATTTTAMAHRTGICSRHITITATVNTMVNITIKEAGLGMKRT